MYYVLLTILIVTPAILLGLNIFLLVARMTGRQDAARKVTRILAPYIWLFRL